MSEPRRGLTENREWLFFLVAAVVVVVVVWLSLPEEREKPAAAKDRVTVVTARLDPIKMSEASVGRPVVQPKIPVSISVPAPPAPASAAPQERVELPLDLAAIETEGSTETPLGENGAVLGQP